MRIFILDGKQMNDKNKAYSHIAKTMCLPDYFGNNLDALADCLSELDNETIVILINKDKLIDGLGEYGQSIVDTFSELSIGEDGFVFVEK